MHVLVIQNQSSDPPGILGDCVIEQGGTMDIVLPLEGQPIPANSDRYDALLIMGGSMNAEQDDQYPYLLAVTVLIRNFHAAAKPVMGVCLGAQLIARAFGKRVYRNDVVEMGFTPVFATDAFATDPVLGQTSKKIHLMQWHYDTFDLPAAAELLMTNEACKHQAYRIGKTTYGFQFHLEVNEAILQEWLQLDAEHLKKHYPDFPQKLTQQMAIFLENSKAFCRTVGNAWLKEIDVLTAAHTKRRP